MQGTLFRPPRRLKIPPGRFSRAWRLGWNTADYATQSGAPLGDPHQYAKSIMYHFGRPEKEIPQFVSGVAANLAMRAK